MDRCSRGRSSASPSLSPVPPQISHSGSQNAAREQQLSRQCAVSVVYREMLDRFWSLFATPAARAGLLLLLSLGNMANMVLCEPAAALGD